MFRKFTPTLFPLYILDNYPKQILKFWGNIIIELNLSLNGIV